ncbi:DUF4349 domain-containing protein [Antribacter gilvus]|uniref:DUF4349 domain-containing protein n=1 Tax=Antribacter gilvus TaxID=2304675 RepID=UPI000F77CD32|nr:DUF4349 domain-containing protein [Antribacter gilvus]
MTRPAPSSRTGRLATRLAALLAGTALVLGLAACSGGGDGGGSSEGAEPAADSAAAYAPSDLGGAAASAEGTVARELVTTGSASIVAADPARTAQDLARIVEQAGGRVEQRSETAGSDGERGSASMTLRVPADRVTPTLEALDSLGEVSQVSIETVDVTGTAQDLDARIVALTTSTDRLRKLMTEAASTDELLEVERELSARQADLDSLRAERDRLSDEVAMSTLRVDIFADEEDVMVANRSGFLGGLAAGWEALVSTFRALLLVLGVLLPWLAVAALVYLVVTVVRRARRTRQARSGGSGGPTAEGPAGPQGPPSHDDGGAEADPDEAETRPAPAPVG